MHCYLKKLIDCGSFNKGEIWKMAPYNNSLMLWKYFVNMIYHLPWSSKGVWKETVSKKWNNFSCLRLRRSWLGDNIKRRQYQSQSVWVFLGGGDMMYWLRKLFPELKNSGKIKWTELVFERLVSVWDTQDKGDNRHEKEE